MRVQHLFALALLGLLAAGCALGRAETEPKRIAVLEFQGSKARGLQHLVADLVAKHHEVVSGKKYRKTARRLRARRMRARHVAKVAAELGVDAVVEGKLIRRGKRKYTLRIEVREGTTGKTIEEYTIPVRKREMSDSNRRTLERKLVGLIEELEPISRNDEADDDYDDYDDGDRDSRRRARRSSKAESRRKARRADKRKAKRATKRRAQRAAKRKARLRAERAERRRAERDEDRHAERRTSRKARHNRQRNRRRARRADPIERIDAELEEDPVVFNDQVDEDGQFIDDEVPAALK